MKQYPPERGSATRSNFVKTAVSSCSRAAVKNLIAAGRRPALRRRNAVSLSSKFFRIFTAIFLTTILSLNVRAVAEAETNSWSLTSPDGRSVIAVSMDADGALSYRVTFAGKVMIAKSPLGLRAEDQAFDRGLNLVDASAAKSRCETYELFTGPASRVDHELNRRSLTFQNSEGAQLAIDLAASNEGVAFRYRFPESSRNVRVLQQELTGFALSSKARGWLQPYHAAGPYTPAYEDFYFHVSPGDRPPHSRAEPKGWAFPALFEVPGAGWALITESGTDEAYCACHLAPDSTGGIYRIAFAMADEHTKGHLSKIGPEPRFTLPWTMPWRVIVLGKSAANIATATWVTDLAPESRVSDTTWIHPGRASWMWWSYPDGPATAERFNEFTDLAATMGWEYTLFDAGWWTPGLQTIADYAKSKNVRPLAWMHAEDFYDSNRRKQRLDEMAAAGVKGVKVDFWCSDRQETMAAMQGLFADAAERKLVVNLHGCTLPRGWQRTWPNFMTAEAVLGTESYFYESRYTEKAAELNTVLPFTRNAVGPMDVTPVACSPKKYKRTTTAAHELATALIATSGIIHYADKPEFFESLPKEALQMFRDAPARWDETRCLIGEPGRLAVFARRAGNSWFIGGINGTSGVIPVTLGLNAFESFSKRLLVEEGTDAAMQVSVSTVDAGAEWKHRIPARGGFILRLDR